MCRPVPVGEARGDELVGVRAQECRCAGPVEERQADERVASTRRESVEPVEQRLLERRGSVLAELEQKERVPTGSNEQSFDLVGGEIGMGRPRELGARPGRQGIDRESR